MDGVLRGVQEHRVRDRQRDRDARHLRAGDEAHGGRNHLRRNNRLRDGEGRLREQAVAEAHDHRVAVHARHRGGLVDGEQKRAAGDDQQAAGGVPRHVVAVGGQDGAVGDDGEDHEHDEWEEAHAGFEGAVVARELEEDREHVDGDEHCGAAGGSHGEEDWRVWSVY